jgi:flagellar biosynthesis protein FlhG
MVPSQKRTRLIAFSSGKGGVGKTFLSLNVAVALAGRGHSVVLFDGDMGLANVHVLLGVQPERDVSDVLAGRCTLSETLLNGPGGIRIVPGVSGRRDVAELSLLELTRVIQDLGSMRPAADYLVIDTGAGIGSQVTTLAQLSDSIVVVVRDEPASLADAYGLIKVMYQDFGSQRFQIIVNDVTHPGRGVHVFERLQQVATRFLGLPLELAGVIPHEPAAIAAIRRRDALLTAFPDSAASLEIRRIAGRIEGLRVDAGNSNFLLDRLGVAAQGAMK